jgi:sulfur carrier protein ThiS
MASKQVSLYVNDAPIEMDFFVQGFVDRVSSGILSSLKGTCRIKNLDFSIEEDTVVINLNGSVVPTNTFVNKITRSTIAGMVSALKGVSDTRRIHIVISR